jgi:hypothetical protein
MAVVARCLAVAVLGALPLAGAATPADADVFLQAQTTATAVHITVTQQPAGSIITASLLDDAVAYAAGDFDSGGTSEALAAPAFPGRLVVQGPQLLCSEVFSCPAAPPSYPLLADASYPRRSRDRAQLGGSAIGSGPLVVTPLTAEATARSAGNDATTSGGTVSLLAGTPGAVTVGASRAGSTVTSSAHALHLVVDSVLTDVSIAGVVHVRALRARDDITVAAGRPPVDHPSITLSGVTAAGRAATIDHNGVHVAGQSGPSVSRQLEQAGASIRTVGVHRDDTTTGGRSDATGLQVDLTVPVSGVPYIPNPLPTLPPPFDQVPALPGVNANGTYVAHVTLGAVGAAAGLGTEPAFHLGGFGTVPTAAGQPSSTGGSTAASAAGSTPRLPTATLPRRPSATSPRVATPHVGGLRGLLDGLTSGDVRTIYAVVALGGLMLFVGWRGSVLLRHGLPRGWWQR